MKRLQRFVKEHYLAMILSFSIPVLLMVVAYYSIEIYPGSERSILATDSFAQYANFHASFNNVLHGKQSIFYTWSGSLGLNYWALAAYYLNGIFTPLVGFFDNANMPDTIYYLTLLKFGASGLAFWFFAKHTFTLNRWLSVGLSISYSLMSYAVGYSEVIMWLDTFVYLPLIIWGIHRLMDQRKPTLLFTSYLLLFLSNFYMAFMAGVFTFLYTVIRTLLNRKKYKGRFISYLITSLLAGGASMVTILPAILDLRTNGESLSEITDFFTADTGPWDFIAKSMAGVYDTSKYESMPFIYIGLVPLIFCVYYFVCRKISWKEKLGYGSLGLLLIASVYIYPLNLFWHGLHAPNMFLFRFSFLFSFLVILLAGYGMEQFEKADSNRLINSVLGIGGVFLLMLFLANKKRYDVITMESLVITIGLLIIYLMLWLLWVSPSKWSKWVPVLLVLLMGVEALFNAKNMVTGILYDWGYPSRVLYAESYDNVKTLTDSTKQEEQNFFRLENLDVESLNTSFNFGSHGVSMFSSIRNRHSSQYLNALGYRSLGTNLTIDYKNNTLLADTLVGVKYNVAKGELLKFGYTKIGKSGEYSLYENEYALPLGIWTDEEIYKSGAVANQTELFNHLSGIKGELFSFGEATLVNSMNAVVTEEEQTISIAETEPNLAKQVTWLVTVPAKQQAYLSLVVINLADSVGIDVKTTVGGVTRKSGLVNSGQYYNLGYFEEPTTVQVTAEISGGQQKVELYRPDAVFLDTEHFAEAAGRMQEKGVDFQVEGRRARAEVSLENEQVLLTTIPYDKGWEVYIDGEKAEVKTFKDAFLSVAVLPGEHIIEFVFLPSGFVMGASLFVGCILLFLLYLYWQKRNGRIVAAQPVENQSAEEEEIQ
ncbi:YfhO family protein [Enterococcus sp. CWB-B31]|uniref:YfhO family protein n=1 Tax=Enterococcus sp. CWB-B31 TaxID=2885159 RepID=UPI001E31D01B|nr:YfhO family protein [Enterococcus sp. CWB-B31]MCB5954980.1 YfhO family protein [Enterococcus sp. CWB-B31]